eukprot:g16872.t1
MEHKRGHGPETRDGQRADRKRVSDRKRGTDSGRNGKWVSDRNGVVEPEILSTLFPPNPLRAVRLKIFSTFGLIGLNQWMVSIHRKYPPVAWVKTVTT